MTSEFLVCQICERTLEAQNPLAPYPSCHIYFCSDCIPGLVKEESNLLASGEQQNAMLETPHGA